MKSSTKSYSRINLDNQNLDISIVIPVKNEQDSIIDLLTGLLNQTKKPSEIIIIDSGSTDLTLDRIRNFSSKLNLCNISLKVHFNFDGYPGANRNIGVKFACCDLIAFIDAGIVPSPNWLASLWSCMKKSHSSAVFGQCEFNGKNSFGVAVCGVSAGCGKRLSVLPASLFHRNVFNLAGFFREDLRSGEDLLWMRSVEKVYGSRIICYETCVFYYDFPANTLEVAKKWILYQQHLIKAGLPNKLTWLLFLFFSTLILMVVIAPFVALISFLIYIVIRGFVDPCLRSGKFFWWGRFPKAMPIAPWVAFIIDCSKAYTLAFYLFNMSKKLLRFQR